MVSTDNQEEAKNDFKNDKNRETENFYLLLPGHKVVIPFDNNHTGNPGVLQYIWQIQIIKLCVINLYV